MRKFFESDATRFEKIEQSLLECREVRAGDFIEMPDGVIGRISVIHEDDTMQVSNGVGACVGVDSILVSGSMWDYNFDKYGRPNKNDLVLTNKTHKGNCWTWSQGEVGGDRGVYKDLDFKLWKIK